MKFDKEKIMQEDVIIHCDEKWKAEELLKWADKQGYVWRDGDSFLQENNWGNYKKNTCYDFNVGYYCDLSFYENNGYKILKFEEVVIKEFDEFEVGDRVWDIKYGWGEVVSIDEYNLFSVKVVFERLTKLYSKNGKDTIDKNRTLFFEEIKIPESATKRPRWRAEKKNDFYYISVEGKVCTTADMYSKIYDEMYESGNYFKTEEDAKNSKIYKAFHGDD